MKRVTGIGGIFFKARDPVGLKDWYRERLGIVPSPDGTVTFEWRNKERPDEIGYTVWAPFSQDSEYFHPSTASFMVNFRVADLYGLLERLREEGVTVDDKTEDSEYGRFGWVMDPEGNRIELWEPPQPK